MLQQVFEYNTMVMKTVVSVYRQHGALLLINDCIHISLIPSAGTKGGAVVDVASLLVLVISVLLSVGM